MHPQAMLDLFVKLAKPRLWELVKLKSAEHIYDPTPARAPASFSSPLGDVALNKFPTSVQPYKDIQRFVRDERVMTYIVDPGLIPIVKSLLLDIRGQRLLITRKVAPRPAENEATLVAHVEGVGLRVISQHHANGETVLTWECLYGVR